MEIPFEKVWVRDHKIDHELVGYQLRSVNLIKDVGFEVVFKKPSHSSSKTETLMKRTYIASKDKLILKSTEFGRLHPAKMLPEKEDWNQGTWRDKSSCDAATLLQSDY